METKTTTTKFHAMTIVDDIKKGCHINQIQGNDKIGNEPTMSSTSTGSEEIDDTDKDENKATDDDGDDEDDNYEDENDAIDHDDDEYAYHDDDDSDSDSDYYHSNLDNYISTPETQQSFKTFCDISLQAEKEKSSSKLRVANDLFRIMKNSKNRNNNGFSIQPTNDDCVDEWTIHLFDFNTDEKLAQDMIVCNIKTIELCMKFPTDYPFEPPFVRVVKPRFVELSGFVINGALCMELLTKEGWNPVNDIESVIISIRSLISVGEGRLEAANNMDDNIYNKLLEKAQQQTTTTTTTGISINNDTYNDGITQNTITDVETGTTEENDDCKISATENIVDDSYSEKDATETFEQISACHKANGWDNSWIQKG